MSAIATAGRLGRVPIEMLGKLAQAFMQGTTENMRMQALGPDYKERQRESGERSAHRRAQLELAKLRTEQASQPRQMGIKQIDTNFRSLQLIQIREFERDTILQVFGVSPEILGIVKSGAGSRATITMADSIYARRVLVPRLELIRSVLQQRLVAEYDDRLILDYDTPVREDTEAQLKAATVAPWSLLVDEWRERSGAEPLPDGTGQVHMVPQNLQPMDVLTPPQSEEPEPEPDVPDDDQPDDDQPDPAGGEAGRAAGPEHPQPQPQPRSSRVSDADAKATDALMVASDARDATKLARLMCKADPDDPPATRLEESRRTPYRDAQLAAWSELTADVGVVAAAIAANRPDEVLDAFGGVAAVAAALTDVLKEHGISAFMRGAELGMEDVPPATQREPIGFGFEVINPLASEWALSEAAELIVGIGPRTEETIRAMIALANELGIAPIQLARDIVDMNMISLLKRQTDAVIKFRERLESQGVARDLIKVRTSKFAQAQLRLRAMNIARTEIMTALNEGQKAAWQVARERGLLPEGVLRVWLVAWDERLDPSCEEVADDETGLNEPFSNGSFGPPLHPLCRCSVGLSKIPARSKREK